MFVEVSKLVTAKCDNASDHRATAKDIVFKTRAACGSVSISRRSWCCLSDRTLRNQELGESKVGLKELASSLWEILKLSFRSF